MQPIIHRKIPLVTVKNRQKGRGWLVLDGGVARPITYDVALLEDPTSSPPKGAGYAIRMESRLDQCLRDWA